LTDLNVLFPINALAVCTNYETSVNEKSAQRRRKHFALAVVR